MLEILTRRAEQALMMAGHVGMQINLLALMLLRVLEMTSCSASRSRCGGVVIHTVEVEAVIKQWTRLEFTTSKHAHLGTLIKRACM